MPALPTGENRQALFFALAYALDNDDIFFQTDSSFSRPDSGIPASSAPSQKLFVCR